MHRPLVQPKTSALPSKLEVSQKMMQLKQAQKALRLQMAALKHLPSRDHVRPQEKERKGVVTRAKVIRFHDRTGKRRRGPNRPWDHARIARYWTKGWSISRIAQKIDRVDPGSRDPYHSLRNCLFRMHKNGWRDINGKLHKLPHRVSASTLKKSSAAGRRAW